jgi:HD-GYP domain
MRRRENLQAVQFSEQAWNTLQSELAATGFNSEVVTSFPQPLRERLLVLPGVVANVLRTIRHVSTLYDELSLTPEQRDTFQLGSLFSDLGKSGPAKATQEQQNEIALVFRPQAGGDPNTILLKDFLKHRGLEHRDLLAHLEELGLQPDAMTMRVFYNHHILWTQEILEQAGSVLPAEAVRAALVHHQLDGYPPGVEEVELDVVAKLIIIADKYDAFRCRSEWSHADTITELRRKVKQDLGGRYGEDKEFAKILDVFEGGMPVEGYCNGLH